MSQKNNWVELQNDVKPHLGPLGTAAETVRDQDVSNYPILFAYGGLENEQAPGLFVLEIPTNRGIRWRVNVSTLEELVAKQIITTERIDPFRKVYKEKTDMLCFLIVDEEGARFGFVPK